MRQAKMSQANFHLYLVSEAPDERLAAARKAASTLHPGADPIEHPHLRVRSDVDLGRVLAELEREPGIVLHALADPGLAALLVGACRALGCPALSVRELAADGGD